MADHFRPYAPEQPSLLPPDPCDWLSEDHLAYCIRDVLQQLDLAPFRAGYSRDGRQIQLLEDVADAVGQVVLGEPVTGIGRQQRRLLGCIGTEVICHTSRL